MSYCSDKVISHSNSQNSQTHNHSYKPPCSTGQFNDGYHSHIRGFGSSNAPNTHVFPGTYQLGNESGINAPIYVSNPDVGNIITIKSRHDGYGPYGVFHR